MTLTRCQQLASFVKFTTEARNETVANRAAGRGARRVERFEPREEFTEYPFAGTYSFARGIFVGERKLGSSFALPKIQRIRAGDFIYCKIMAWEGAFGIAPKETDSEVVLVPRLHVALNFSAAPVPSKA